ncbi:TPA: adhesin, partial [Escherichia coli]|nr:adhesin [Escherichia coli]
MAEHNNSVAIGGGSTTDREYSVSFGTGNTNRQLTHVAAGTEDTDGVNVKQLKDYTGNEIAKNNTVINQNINNAKN